MSTNPDRIVQLARILNARQRLQNIRRSDAHHRLSHQEERFAEQDERTAVTIFVASEIAAHLTPVDLRYDGIGQIGSRWSHHFTELEAGVAHGGSFSVTGLDIDADLIARARAEHRTQFSQQTSTPMDGAGASASTSEPPRQPTP